jgi:hypothetical protein
VTGQVKELKELYSNKHVKELEKELYNKECIAESINFVVGKASKGVSTLNVHKFSCNLATILAKDKEVIAVRLKVLPSYCEIYLAKNSAWSNRDDMYIAEITNYLKDMLKRAPTILRNTESAFTRAVSSYRSAKLETRLEKLINNIKYDNEHVKPFKDFYSTKVNDVNKKICT